MKKGIVFGTWDLLHAGHMALLQEAAEHCDYLIVGLHVDPSIERKQKSKPIESLFERAMRLRFVPYVTEVICYETEADLLDTLLTIMPDVRFLGSDYKGREFTGSTLDIPIHWVKREHLFSSTRARKRLKEAS